MQPIEIVERVKTTCKNYIRTAFPILDDGLRAQAHARIEQENLLWRGPYLSLQRPYALAERTLAELGQELGLHPRLLAAGEWRDSQGERLAPFGEWRLFNHQLAAVRQLLADGRQCERSCYKCLRSYENQFEHRLLDKQRLRPFLDHLLGREAVTELLQPTMRAV